MDDSQKMMSDKCSKSNKVFMNAPVPYVCGELYKYGRKSCGKGSLSPFPHL